MSALLSVTGGIASGAAAQIYNYGNTVNSHGIQVQGGAQTGGGFMAIFYRGGDGALVGSISQASATSVAYNTTSDRRLKENIVDSTSGLDLLSKIRVRDYNYISDPGQPTLQGFIAQELYEIYPQAVTVGREDPKTHPWQVDYGKLTPLLVKSVQDLQSENDQLKARADKAEADSMAKDDAIARLRAEKNAEIGQLKAESAQLKGFLCGQFPNAPMCQP